MRRDEQEKIERSMGSLSTEDSQFFHSAIVGNFHRESTRAARKTGLAKRVSREA
jgi:hypothetical protein